MPALAFRPALTFVWPAAPRPRSRPATTTRPRLRGPSLAEAHSAALVVRAAVKAYPQQLAMLERLIFGRNDPQRANPPPDGAAVKVALALVREQIVDRLAAAEEAGVLDVLYECRSDPEPSVSLTDGELARLLQVMLREEFPWPLATPQRTAHPPGSPGKIEAMAGRLERGESLCVKEDADLTGAVIVERANGSGRKVLGKRP